MNIVFLSNYFNHHQKSFSDITYSLVNYEYTFIETRSMPHERKNMGWGIDTYPDYVVSNEVFHQKRAQCQDMIDQADVVIIGSAPASLVKRRIAEGKLVFRYSERPLKRGLELLYYPAHFLRWHLQWPQRKNIFLLCASAYTASDYRKFGMFKNKAYKWGYFPKTKRYANISALLRKKDPQKLLWCGRFLDWKHPEYAIEALHKLTKIGEQCTLDLIGQGPEENNLRALVKTYGLEDKVRFLGSMSPDQVRLHMEQAGIYLFTSNRQEGWGAVLNESMNSACAVVASHAIGSAPFLVTDGENGLIYKSGNINDLTEKIHQLLAQPEIQYKYGYAAYRTITECWSAEVASMRFVQLAESLLSGNKQPVLFDDGPCSLAQ